MNHTRFKRLAALVLCLVMCLTLLPPGVMAADKTMVTTIRFKMMNIDNLLLSDQLPVSDCLNAARGSYGYLYSQASPVDWAIVQGTGTTDKKLDPDTILTKDGDYYLRITCKPDKDFTFGHKRGYNTTTSVYINGKKMEGYTMFNLGDTYDVQHKDCMYIYIPLTLYHGKFTVTYDLNGGSGYVAPETDAAGCIVRLKSQWNYRDSVTPPPYNGELLGWTLEPDGKTTVTRVPAKGNVTVYAKWSSYSRYSISLNETSSHGTVTFPKEAYRTEPVEVYIYPDKGYAVADLKVCISGTSDTAPVTKTGPNSWKFEMPRGNVTLDVTYTESENAVEYSREDIYPIRRQGGTFYLKPNEDFKSVEISEGKLPSGLQYSFSMAGLYIYGATEANEDSSVTFKCLRQDNTYLYHTVDIHPYNYFLDDETELSFDMNLGDYRYLPLPVKTHGDELLDLYVDPQYDDLPQGMRLNCSMDNAIGIIGQPIYPGTYIFRVVAVRSDNSIHELWIDINVQAESEEIAEEKTVKLGEPMHWQLQPDAFEFERVALIDGCLPEGLSTMQNNNYGYLAGTPTEAGLFESVILFVRSDYSVVYDTVTLRVLAENCGGDSDACPGWAFTDMPKYTNWAHAGIDFVVYNGLMNGTSATTFAPKLAMSRSMLVTVLYRMEGEPGAGKTTFTDVKPTSWYGPAVSWAADLGIVNGVGNGKFNPNGDVTREQLAAILYRYAQHKGYNTAASADISGFADAAKIGKWYADGVKWAVALELIKGSDKGGQTYVDPQGAATREQIAAILMRFCQNAAK